MRRYNLKYWNNMILQYKVDRSGGSNAFTQVTVCMPRHLACFNLIGLREWHDGGASDLSCRLACIDITWFHAMLYLNNTSPSFKFLLSFNFRIFIFDLLIIPAGHVKNQCSVQSSWFSRSTLVARAARTSPMAPKGSVIPLEVSRKTTPR